MPSAHLDIQQRLSAASNACASTLLMADGFPGFREASSMSSLGRYSMSQPQTMMQRRFGRPFSVVLERPCDRDNLLVAPD